MAPRIQTTVRIKEAVTFFGAVPRNKSYFSPFFFKRLLSFYLWHFFTRRACVRPFKQLFHFLLVSQEHLDAAVVRLESLTCPIDSHL